MRTKVFAAVAAGALVTSLAATASASGASAAVPSGTAFWTRARMDAAQSREYVLDANGKATLVIASKGRPGGGGGGAITGASYNGGGLAKKAVGKVFFSVGINNYVCSGSVVSDGVSGRSVVLTAGHCAFDQRTQAFVGNWMFVPDYDSNPTGSCTSLTNPFPYGCWDASALVVRHEFANQSSFNSVAIPYDWAFAVIKDSDHGNRSLESVVGGSFPLYASAMSPGWTATSFGYPAASPYSGSDLVYCQGATIDDPNMSNLTWGLGCNMTGGASGGPWMRSFSGGTGSLASVNSYKYTLDKSRMYGPKFNDATIATWNSAKTVGVNTKV